MQWEGKSWIRNRDWKLYANGDLFNMKKDTAEKNPILVHQDNAASGEIRKQLQDELTRLKGGKVK